MSKRSKAPPLLVDGEDGGPYDVLHRQISRGWPQAEAGAALENSEPVLAARLDVLAIQLAKLDRYERRAVSFVEKAAIRAFERDECIVARRQLLDLQLG